MIEIPSYSLCYDLAKVFCRLNYKVTVYIWVIRLCPASIFSLPYSQSLKISGLRYNPS